MLVINTFSFFSQNVFYHMKDKLDFLLRYNLLSAYTFISDNAKILLSVKGVSLSSIISMNSFFMIYLL